MAKDRGVGTNPASERRYFLVGAILTACFAIAAFTPSFFLHDLFQRPAPRPFFIFHGILMTGWMLLFVIQCVLVAIGRTEWHRQLGYAGVAFGAFTVPVGCMATLLAAAREVHAHSRFMSSQVSVLGLDLAQILLFGGFLAAGTILRKRLDWHKRLMLMATLALIPNAIVRASFTPVLAFLDTNLRIINAWMALIALMVALDMWRTGFLHGAFVRSVPVAAAVTYLAWAAGATSVWQDFWLRSLG